MKEYLFALKVDPNFPDAHYNLGNVYKTKGMKDKAREEFEAALKLRPDFTEAKEALEFIKIR